MSRSNSLLAQEITSDVVVAKKFATFESRKTNSSEARIQGPYIPEDVGEIGNWIESFVLGPRSLDALHFTATP
jgi:hypothetical protein